MTRAVAPLPAPAEQPAVGTGRRSVARNATSLTGAVIAARACTFALAIVMARGLGVSAYGSYGFAVALGSMIVPLFDLGITPYMNRAVARDPAAGELQAIRLVRPKIWLSVAALALTAAIAALISRSLDPIAVVVLMVASMSADGLSSFVYGYFQGRERMGFEAGSTALAAMVRGLGGIACVVAFGDLLPVIGWMLFVSAVQLAVAARRFTGELEHDRPRTPRPSIPIAWGSVVTLGAITLFALIYLQVDAVIIGVVENRHAVGLYVAAYALVGGLQIIPWQIAVALGPALARHHVADRAQFEDSWRRGLRSVLLVSLPLALVTTLLARPILTFAFGSKFGPAATALAILVWSSPIWSVNMTSGAVLRAAGRERWLAWATGVGLTLNVGLNLWAIPEFGIAGASAVTVATEFGVLLIQGWLVISRGIVGTPRLPLVRLLAALLALSAVTIAAAQLPVVLAGALGLSAYVIVILATGTLDATELRALGALASRSS